MGSQLSYIGHLVKLLMCSTFKVHLTKMPKTLWQQQLQYIAKWTNTTSTDTVTSPSISEAFHTRRTNTVSPKHRGYYKRHPLQFIIWTAVWEGGVVFKRNDNKLHRNDSNVIILTTSHSACLKLDLLSLLLSRKQTQIYTGRVSSSLKSATLGGVLAATRSYYN